MSQPCEQVRPAETRISSAGQSVHRTHAPWSIEATISINHFAFIRIALALLVVFSHSFPIALGDNSKEPLFERAGMTLGHIAVNLFLTISGFLVARSWSRSRSTRDFLISRILRIYPAFIVLMLLQAFVLAPLVCQEVFRGYSLKQYAIIGFNICDLVGYGYPYGGLLTPFPDNPHPYEMNGSLWTIRYEFMCYLTLILFSTPMKYKWLTAALFLCTSTFYACGFSLPGNWVTTSLVGDVGFWPRVWSFFLAGVVFYSFRETIPYSTPLATLSILSFTIIPVSPMATTLILLIPGTYLLFYLAYTSAAPSWLRGIPGDPSYGIYLYGFPIQQSIVFLMVDARTLISPYTLAAISMPASLLAGYCSWYLVEKNALNFKQPRRGRCVDHNWHLEPDKQPWF